MHKISNDIGRNSLLPRNAYKQGIQYQMVSPENIIQTEQVVLRDTYVYTYMHIIKINEKRRP